MSFSSDLTYQAFSLGFLLDWKQGGDNINLTEFLYDAGQNSKDYVEAGQKRQEDWTSGKTQVYVQDGVLPQAPGDHPGVQPARQHHPQPVRRVRPLRPAHGERPEPAPLHRLPRARSRGEQLQQPGHRPEHRRGAVPAEQELLLRLRPGLLTMRTTMTLRRIVLLAAVLGMGACSLDLATNPNSPDPIGENPTKGQVVGRRERHAHRPARRHPGFRAGHRHPGPGSAAHRRVGPAVDQRAADRQPGPGRRPLRRRPLAGGVHRDPRGQPAPQLAADRRAAHPGGDQRHVGLREDDPGARLRPGARHPHPGLDPDRHPAGRHGAAGAVRDQCGGLGPRDHPAGRGQHRAGRRRRRVPVHLAHRLPRVRHPGHLRHLQPGAPGPGGGLPGGLGRRADGAGRIVPRSPESGPTCSAAST